MSMNAWNVGQVVKVELDGLPVEVRLTGPSEDRRSWEAMANMGLASEVRVRVVEPSLHRPGVIVA